MIFLIISQHILCYTIPNCYFSLCAGRAEQRRPEERHRPPSKYWVEVAPGHLAAEWTPFCVTGRINCSEHVHRQPAQNAQNLHAVQKRSQGEKEGHSPPLITIPEGKDDCKTTLHQGRWLRFPLAPPKDWYSETPVNRSPVFKAMQFKFFGASNCLANKTIAMCHDRMPPD